jgi:hypothetical protein
LLRRTLAKAFAADIFCWALSVERWALSVFRFELPCLQSLNLGAKIFFRFAELLLQTSQQLILFPLGKREIVIGQLTVFRFQFSLQFVPATLDL